VRDGEWRAQDNRRAVLIYVISAVAAAIVTGLLYLF